MSVGSSALGTLLVQRLDAVLGTTMAQHANLITGARPDAVSQAAAVARLLGPDATAGRNDRETLERTTVTDVRTGAGGRGHNVSASSEELLRAAASRLRHTSTASTASAPTSLGLTARTILALLARFPDSAPPALGRAPLWSPPDGGTHARPGTGSAAPSPPGTTPQPARAEGRLPGAPAAPGQAGSSAAAVAQTAGGPTAAPTAAVLARALAQSLDTSGLFYESHLAGLAFGKRTVAQLASEPQAQLPQSQQSQQPQQPGATGTERPAPPPGQAEARAGTDDARAAQADGARRDGPAPAPPALSQSLATGGVHPESALLVRQQLEILANQIVSWRGEAWPDAKMDWEVAREGEPGAGQGDDQEGWSSKLALDLPRLGRVEAILTLRGDQLVMRLSADQSADALQAQSESLRQRYTAAGFTLAGLAIDDGAPLAPAANAPEPAS